MIATSVFNDLINDLGPTKYEVKGELKTSIKKWMEYNINEIYNDESTHINTI